MQISEKEYFDEKFDGLTKIVGDFRQEARQKIMLLDSEMKSTRDVVIELKADNNRNREDIKSIGDNQRDLHKIIEGLTTDIECNKIDISEIRVKEKTKFETVTGYITRLGIIVGIITGIAAIVISIVE